MTTRTDTLRDKLASRLVNLIMQTLATPQYEKNMRRVLQQGLVGVATQERIPTDAERKLAAQVRVRADQARGLKTPRWIRDLADPPKRTLDIWDMPESY